MPSAKNFLGLLEKLQSADITVHQNRCAVVRNRSKRVLREAARTCRLPRDGYEIILFATPKTRTSSPAEMMAALESLCVRAGLDG